MESKPKEERYAFQTVFIPTEAGKLTHHTQQKKKLFVNNKKIQYHHNRSPEFENLGFLSKFNRDVDYAAQDSKNDFSSVPTRAFINKKTSNSVTLTPLKQKYNLKMSNTVKQTPLKSDK